MLQITELSTHKKFAEWDEFVLNHKEGSPFHLTKWRECVLQVFGHPAFYYCAERDGRIAGVLPMFFLKSRLFGRILASVPYAASGGVLADNQETFDFLMEKAKVLAFNLRADHLELKFSEPKQTGLPESSLYYSFVKKLSLEMDGNLLEIPRKQRRMVRVGIKAGLQAKVSDSFLDVFYNIFAINVRRLGTPVLPKKWFSTLLDVYGNESELMVVEHQGKIVSGVLSLYFNETVLPYYAASLVNYRKYAPNDFQYWSLMDCAVKRGCRFFDFGRSKKGTGHFSYKTHWGFEPKKLHYQYFLNNSTEIPAINPLNPKYQWKIKAWRNMPLWLTKLLGPHIVKYIP